VARVVLERDDMLEDGEVMAGMLVRDRWWVCGLFFWQIGAGIQISCIKNFGGKFSGISFLLLLQVFI